MTANDEGMNAACRTQIDRTHRRELTCTGQLEADCPRALATIAPCCACLRVTEALVTTDFSLEGVHFRREWHPADSVGHRCLVRGLSDIAAMGGEPLAAFLSLALPAELPQRWADEFLNGMLALAQRFGVTLAGGDIAQSPAGVLADITVLGLGSRRARRSCVRERGPATAFL